MINALSSFMVLYNGLAFAHQSPVEEVLAMKKVDEWSRFVCAATVVHWHARECQGKRMNTAIERQTSKIQQVHKHKNRTDDPNRGKR